MTHIIFFRVSVLCLASNSVRYPSESEEFMKILNKLGLSVLLSSGVAATVFAGDDCHTASGPIKTVERKLGAFDELKVSGSFNVTILKGEQAGVKISAASNIVELIETEVSRGKLKLDLKKGCYKDTGRIEVVLTTTGLNDVSLAGSGDVAFKDEIAGKSLDLNIAGSGDLVGKIAVAELEVSIAGSGSIKLDGRADQVDLSIMGSGDVDLTQVASLTADVSIKGSGDATVTATKSFEGNIMGSGNITLIGSPPLEELTKLGSGTFKPIRK